MNGSSPRQNGALNGASNGVGASNGAGGQNPAVSEADRKTAVLTLAMAAVALSKIRDENAANTVKTLGQHTFGVADFEAAMTEATAESRS